VTKSGQGAGTVTSSPAGINCGATCVATYSNGANVTLTATPNSGSRFQGWSGACSGKGACLVSMTANRTVNARFRRARTVVSLAGLDRFGGQLR
jgi:endoglucanase